MNKPYPEHEKLAKVNEESQAIGKFLDWLLNARELHLAMWHEHMDDCRPNGWFECGYQSGASAPAHVSIEDLLAEYFRIDQAALEQEKRAILDTLHEKVNA